MRCADRVDLLGVLRSRALDCAVGPAESGGWVAVDFGEDVDHALLAGVLSTVLDTPVVVCASDDKRATLPAGLVQVTSALPCADTKIVNVVPPRPATLPVQVTVVPLSDLLAEPGPI